MYVYVQAFAADVINPLNDRGLARRVKEKVMQMAPQEEEAEIRRHHMFRGGDGGS